MITDHTRPLLTVSKNNQNRLPTVTFNFTMRYLELWIRMMGSLIEV